MGGFLMFLMWVLAVCPGRLALPSIGVTYSGGRRSPGAAERIGGGLERLKSESLRVEESDPSITRSLLYTNTSLFLTIPNYMVTPMAQNRSTALSWLYANVIPFYPRVNITTISVGNAFPDVYPNSVDDLLPAIANLHLSLRDLGIRKITVSTSFSFVTAISSPFPPSSAQFRDPPGATLFGPLLQFLHDTNSSFFINLYPYNLYRLRPEIPLGIALFQDHPFNFRDDFTTGVRYRNLFDVMVDAVVSALAVAGYETVPVVVTETGWPSASSAANELEANAGYAEIYLRGLVKHLKSGMGTPLLREGVREVFVYEMFDKDEGSGSASASASARSWGLLFPNGTSKYHLHLSSSSLSTLPLPLLFLFLFSLFLLSIA